MINWDVIIIKMQKSELIINSLPHIHSPAQIHSKIEELIFYLAKWVGGNKLITWGKF